MDLSQLFTEREKVLNGERFLWVPQSFDKGNRLEAGMFDV